MEVSVSPSCPSLDQKIHLKHSREIDPPANPRGEEAHQGRGRNNQGSRRLLPIPRRRNFPGHRMVFARVHQMRLRLIVLHVSRAMNPVVRSDIPVSHFLDSVGGYRHKERRDLLLDLLDIDLDWHMHNISDGERRRVQLCMGLMAPWDVLLLDEVTVDLDVLVRHELLEFLKRDSEARSATIICQRASSPTSIQMPHRGISQMPHTYLTA